MCASEHGRSHDPQGVIGSNPVAPTNILIGTKGIFAMNDEAVFVAILAALMLADVAGEGYSPAEVYYCPAAQPCTAQEGLPPPMSHGPEWDSSNSGRSFTTSVMTATGPTGSAGAFFGGSGGFSVNDEGIRVIKGSLGPTGPAGPARGLAPGARSGFVATGPAGP